MPGVVSCRAAEGAQGAGANGTHRLARYELQLAQRLHRHRQGRAQRVHLGNLRPQLLHLKKYVSSTVNQSISPVRDRSNANSNGCFRPPRILTGLAPN